MKETRMSRRVEALAPLTPCLRLAVDVLTSHVSGEAAFTCAGSVRRHAHVTGSFGGPSPFCSRSLVALRHGGIHLFYPYPFFCTSFTRHFFYLMDFIMYITRDFFYSGRIHGETTVGDRLFVTANGGISLERRTFPVASMYS